MKDDLWGKRLKPLPPRDDPKPKAVVPKGQVRAVDFETQQFQEAFKKRP